MMFASGFFVLHTDLHTKFSFLRIFSQKQLKHFVLSLATHFSIIKAIQFIFDKV